MVQKQLSDPLRDPVGGVVGDAGESGELVVGGDDRFTRLPAQCRVARMIDSERAPTNMRLEAQTASRLNQLRDRNFSPR